MEGMDEVYNPIKEAIALQSRKENDEQFRIWKPLLNKKLADLNLDLVFTEKTAKDSKIPF